MAPGTGLPLASVTTPLTDFSWGAAFFFWPNAKAARASTNSTTVNFLSICHQLKPLNPPGLRRLLLNHNVIQKPNGLPQSFFRRQQTVLMLDRQHVIVAIHPQG